MRNNKFVAIISIIIMLAVIVAVGAYLFVATDIFKSDRELFAKYFTQELQNIENITNLKTTDIYKTLESLDKFENKVNIKMIHSEGGEVSNPLNDISAKLEVQKDAEQEYFYADAQILNKDEKYIEAEIIKSEENYGIRFPDVFKQFVTIEKDENVGIIANELGLDAAQLEKIMGIIDGSESIISEEQENTINTKKSNIINILSNGTFEKQKNAMITYNNATTKTNAYSVSLTSEQVKNMALEIDEELDETVEFPTAKVTVYVQKQVPIRTVVEADQHKVMLENFKENGILKTRINYSYLSDEETFEIDTEVTKTNTETQEAFEVIANVTQGEEVHTISFSNKIESVNNTHDIDIEISMVEDITTISLVLDNTVSIGTDFEKIEELNDENYKSLSKVESEEQRKKIIDTLGDMVSADILTKTMALVMPFINEDVTTENVGTEAELSQVDINTFNANFEFYTGEDVSASNVKALLEIVKKHLSSHSITNIEENKTVIDLYIEKDSLNEDGVEEVFEKINDSSKYKVSISYKESNGIVNKITITEM